MNSLTKISIGYSLTDHPQQINDFTNGIPKGIEVNSYLQERYFSIDGQFFHLIITFVNAFSEGMVSGLGEVVFTDLVKRVTKLVKGHVAVYDNIDGKNANFKIRLVNKNGGENIFEAENVNRATVDRALNEFFKIASTGQQPADNKVIYLFDEITQTWLSNNADEIREYITQQQKEAHNRIRN